MSHPILFSTATPTIPNLISRSPLRHGFPVVLLVLTLTWFALSPTVRGVDPPPDGGYPNQNTAEGDGALFSLITGDANTAIGFDALYSNKDGFENTATGSYALYSNIEGYSNTATGSGALFSNGDGGLQHGHWYPSALQQQ